MISSCRRMLYNIIYYHILSDAETAYNNSYDYCQFKCFKNQLGQAMIEFVINASSYFMGEMIYLQLNLWQKKYFIINANPKIY
ncbi:MAG: hypothetical protein Kow0019_13630 [Methanobacteriaceae archaeon]